MWEIYTGVHFRSGENPHYEPQWGNHHYYLYFGVGDTRSDASGVMEHAPNVRIGSRAKASPSDLAHCRNAW